MPNEIKVHVVNYGPDRKALYMRYVDPITGKQKTKTTKTRNAKEAAKIAAKWEADLQEGRYKSPSTVTWQEFRQRYEDEKVSSMAPASGKKVDAAFNAVEEHIDPARLASLGSEQIAQLQVKLRGKGLTENTIKSHMATLKAALNWAKRSEILRAVPNIEMPKRTKTAKHRPITGEEYERMLDAVQKVVGENRAPDWKRLLTGLWWSGLRLGEAINMTWDDDRRLCVDLSGKRPMLWIPASGQKNYRNTLLPLAPEFAEMLLATPENERTGFVFNPATVVVKDARRIKVQQVTRIVSLIGVAAGVKVGTDEHSGEPQHASAHDFRRAFGDRWSKRVMPAVLKQLMRHSNIMTTMQYYVGEDAQATAELLYQSLPDKTGNSSGNSAPSRTKSPAQQKTETIDVQ